MDSILEWGISFIASIQAFRTPFLDVFFKTISDVGSEYFYFAALPIIITMIDRKMGIRFALMILVSVTINSLLKHWVAEPRPFMLDPSVMVVQETGFGFPSGHTQQAALFWGLVALQVRNRWMTVLAVIFVGLIGFSRMYLGVHYPTDVLGSLAIAGMLLWMNDSIAKTASQMWAPQRRRVVAGLIFVIAVLASALSPVKDMISGAGLGAGLVAGLAFVPTLTTLPASLRSRTMVAGLTAIILLAAYIGLKLVFPKNGADYYELFSFIRYGVCGVVIAAVPVMITKRL